MEGDAALFMDPEEDEVFFYDVTERESVVKSALENKMKLEIEKKNVNCSNKNDHSSKDTEGIIESENSLDTIKTLVGFDQVTDMHCLSNSSNFLSASCDRSLKNHKNIADQCPATATCQDDLTSQALKENIQSPKKQNTLERKKYDQRYDVQSLVDIHTDHSYFTQIKNVIDKNILKTPKCIVKADKDGGFLNILSEIALFKAEEDENNVGDIKKLTNISSDKEVNDDDKENKQSDTEKANTGIKQADLPPTNIYQGLTVNKANNESQKKVSCFVEKINEEHSDFSAVSPIRNKKFVESVKEQFVGNQKGELESFNNDPVLNDFIDELYLEKCLTLKKEKSLSPNIAFEKPNDSLINNELIKEKETTEIPNSHILKEIDNFKGKSLKESIILKETEDPKGICCSQNKFLENESGVGVVPELTLLATNMETEGKNDVCLSVKDIQSSEKERHKKFVRRNTMRLLEELNELVTFGQAKRESLGTVCNTKLSEEAAKVIQKLKAVGFDDSISSPEQYFDLDKLDNSVFNSEICDILNDTLSKPLSHVSSKDVESLLEKITTNVPEAENEINSGGELNSKQGNSDNATMNKNVISESAKPTTDQQKPSNFEAEQFETSENDSNRSKHGISVQHDINVLSENKYVIQKSILPSQTTETKPKEFRSADKKYKGLTKIPKLVSTTSKVPVTAKEVKQQLGYSATNKSPFLKAQKSLKFNNIDSTVNTNFNLKMPITLSTGKGKAATKDVTSNTKAKSVNNKSNARNLFPKSETKLNSQFHVYKSAASSKGNSTESHLPKFIPKVQKVTKSGSPVTSNCGGGLQRITPKRP